MKSTKRHRSSTGTDERVVPLFTDAPGILDQRSLPDPAFDELWDSLILDQGVKDRILGQSILNFTVRPRLRRAVLPLHGVILLVGPPGTGKTSLARGLASRVARVVRGAGVFHFAEVEPHALASASLGKSQQAVTRLLGGTIAEASTNGPLIVLLDEVETLATDRTRLSLEANPVDVHRATDAVLAQLDHLAATRPNLLFLATSNFATAIDEAFLSRADLVELIDLPSVEACEKILRDTVQSLADAYPALSGVANEDELAQAARHCEGLDGRRVRKVVLAAIAQSKELALDPGRLTVADIVKAAKQASAHARPKKESP